MPNGVKSAQMWRTKKCALRYNNNKREVSTMPYYNSPMAYPAMYGQPGGYGQTPYNPGGTMQQAAQRYEIIHVNGEPGARALQMAPNSNAIVMDDTAPIVWLCQTDGAGYKTVQPFDIAPHQAAPAVDVSSLDTRVKRLEEIINGKQPNDAVPATPGKRPPAAK